MHCPLVRRRQSIAHINPDIVTMIIGKIEDPFGKMTVTRGKEHVFLGMNIRYTENRTAIITMKEKNSNSNLSYCRGVVMCTLDPYGWTVP